LILKRKEKNGKKASPQSGVRSVINQPRFAMEMVCTVPAKEGEKKKKKKEVDISR